MNVLDLINTNVNEHTEKKGNLTYLSWAWAWDYALKADQKASFQVKTFQENSQTVPYMSIGKTKMVWVTVTVFGKPMTCQLPVMDHRNKALPDPDAFAVNTAIMRCLAKALALHGLGLYIYSGEDLPDAVVIPSRPKTEDLNIEPDVLKFLEELTQDVEGLCKEGKAQEARLAIKAAGLDQDQRIALDNMLSSKARTAMKKAKEIEELSKGTQDAHFN